MKILLKSFAILFAFSAMAQAELWVKPTYKPDENHPPILVPKEAQEESPDEIKEMKRHQDIKKPDAEKGLEKIDDEMNEGEESTQ